MKFPAWAPAHLVSFLERKINLVQDMHKLGYPGREWMKVEEERSVNAFGQLTLGQTIEYLKKLLTDPEMEQVWSRLSKQVRNISQYEKFWEVCETGIASFERKEFFRELSPVKNEKFFTDIYDRVIELREMIVKNREFHNNHEARDALEEIAINASKYVEIEAPKVNNPGSGSANIRIFVRQLSAFMRSEFGAPMNLAVATTASVIFGTEITEEYVKKTIRSKEAV